MDSSNYGDYLLPSRLYNGRMYPSPPSFTLLGLVVLPYIVGLLT